MNNSVDRYRHLFAYERESHAKVLSALRQAPGSAQRHEAFQKAVDLMAHIATARRRALWRIGCSRENPADLFPKGRSIDEVISDFDAIQNAWTEALDSLAQADLERMVEFRSPSNPDQGFRCRLDDVLTQLHGHSLYHRGQIALLMREAGLEPVSTEYLLWAAQPLATS